MECMNYNNYTGSSEILMDEDILFGKILFINDVVTFQAGTPAGLRAAFEEAVDDYIETCALVGKEPEKRLSGSFNIRTTPEKHKALKIKALKDHDGKLSHAVNEAIDQYLSDKRTIDVNVNHNHEHSFSQDVNFNQEDKRSDDWSFNLKVVGGTDA